tara:strand:- start:64 stop:1137 length:1074 start_codon:yes stop_codon:yes gene_type:complete
MRYKLREQSDTSFSPEQIKILDSKVSSRLRDSIYSSLDDIYNTKEKKDELFNQTIDKVDSVISGYSELSPSTSLEKKLFLVKIGQGSRADNIGPGELFVVLATKNTTFGTVGDVNSNGEEIEIKRSASTELNITYSAGGIFKFFPILQDLNGLVSNVKDPLRKYLPEFKSLSPNSRLLFKYLAKGFNKLKIDPKQSFEGETFKDTFKEYKDLFSLKRNDFIENDIDKEFIDSITQEIERKIQLLDPELFKNGFKTALKTYFGKGFDYILFYKNLQPFLLEVNGIEENVDVNSSTIRGGYQIYIKLKKSALTIVAKPEQLNEGEKYSSGEKIERGYGITTKFMSFIHTGLNRLLSNLK